MNGLKRFENWTRDWPKGERVIALANYQADHYYRKSVDDAFEAFASIIIEAQS